MEIVSFCENVLADVEIWKLQPVLKYLTDFDKYFKAYGQKLGSSFWFYNVHVHTAASYLSLVFRVFNFIMNYSEFNLQNWQPHLIT